MLNRRLIRIKIFQVLYAHLQSDNHSLQTSVKALNKSLLGIQNTFNALIAFPFEFAHYVEVSHNPSEKKYRATDENNQHYRLLIASDVLNFFKSNKDIQKSLDKPSYNWFEDSDFLFIMHKKIVQNEKFMELSQKDVNSFEVQKEYLTWLYQYLLEESEDFDLKMEEMDMHWADEKYPLNSSIKKMIQRIESDTKPEIIDVPEISKDLEDDLKYAKELLSICVNQEKEFEQLIATRTPGWDPDRIAKPDMILMYMALGEFLEFPNIPVKATINEYLELAKMYSTPQSSKFLNGILDKLLKDLTAEKKIVKKGRGLVG